MVSPLLQSLRFFALLAAVVSCGCSSSRWNPWTRSAAPDYENRSGMTISEGAPYPGAGNPNYGQTPGGGGFKASISGREANARISDDGNPDQSYQRPAKPYSQNAGFSPPPKTSPRAPFAAPNNPALARPQNGVFRQPNPSLEQQGKIFEPGQVVARVGDQTILAGDLLGDINQILAPYMAKMPPEQLEQQKEDIEKARRKLMQRFLRENIESKLLYLQFLRKVPTERLAEIEQQMIDDFDESFESVKQKVATLSPDDSEALAKLARSEPILAKLAVLGKKDNLGNSHELDARLRSFGSSLLKQKRAFAEYRLGRSMISREVDVDPEITPDEIRAYYREHQDEFATEAKVRWEQLMVRYDKFLSKEAAHQEIVEMGNEVYLGGAPLSAVAKRSSQGPEAEQGGYHDWISKGSLASKAVDEAIFTLPPNRLSEIIEDDRGFHIIRVLERVDSGSQPFQEAQTDIKLKIRRKKIGENIAEYQKKLQETTPVWTIFDEEDAQQTAETPGAQSRY